MMEPSIWLQMGISEERHPYVEREIRSILKTQDTIGNMMLMVKDSSKLSNDEKLYAAFMVSKTDIHRRLEEHLPDFAVAIVKRLLEE